MLEDWKLPEAVRRRIAGKEAGTDDVGMSGARILLFEDCVLKIVRFRRENDKTVEMMRWLEGKLPVPRVLCWERDETYQYLLMSRVPGKMSCDDAFFEKPRELAARLAEALRLLWSVDVTGCPRIRDLDAELREARYRVDNGLVDLENAEPGTFGEGGFRDPADLLRWLEENRPDYEPVLSHGDFCLPNVLFDGEKLGGFIDLEDAGVGDKWRDVALCWRSLRNNAAGVYGGRVWPDVQADLLFEALELEPKPEKLRYYLLLDELF